MSRKKKLIEKVRDEIKSCWDMCLKSDADRLRFQSYTAVHQDVIERDHEAKRQEKLKKREERRSPSPNTNGPEAKNPLLGAFASPAKAKVNGNGTGALQKPAIKITSPGDQGSE